MYLSELALTSWLVYRSTIGLQPTAENKALTSSSNRVTHNTTVRLPIHSACGIRVTSCFCALNQNELPTLGTVPLFTTNGSNYPR